MGYLNNSIITVDAILTKKGRELLAKGDGSFRITQFALSDDEIDYTLYNPSHPSGSAFYGEAIENMPLLEAFPDETQIMKYKLVTLPRGTAKMPILDIGYSSITLKQGASLAITPQTLNYLGNSETFETSGYTVTISDVSGNAVSWSSSGSMGFRGSKKSTPYAAQVAADDAGAKAFEQGMRTLTVQVKGPGSGRETALRSLQSTGFKILSIKDTTPMPHNGARPPKRRRV